MRLQPVRAPDALHAGVRDARRFRHAARLHLRRIRRLLMQGHMHDPLDRLRRERLASRRARGVFQEPVHALRHIAATPAPHREQALAHRRGDRLRRQPIACQKHDPRSPNQLLRRVPVPDQPLQSLTIGIADQNPFDLPHRRRLAGLSRFVNPSSAPEH